MPGNKFGIADESIFIDGGDIGSFFKDIQRLIDGFWEHPKTFLEDPAHHFFTIYVKYFLDMFQYELFDKILDILGHFIDEK